MVIVGVQCVVFNVVIILFKYDFIKKNMKGQDFLVGVVRVVIYNMVLQVRMNCL